MFKDKKSWCIRDQSWSFLCSKLAPIVGKPMLTAQNWETPPQILRPPEPGSGACDWNVAKSTWIDL